MLRRMFWVAVLSLPPLLTAAEADTLDLAHYESPKIQERKDFQAFQPFTGKLVRDRVRLRTLPSLDAPIYHELNKGDLLVITGETGEFFAVKPLPHTKAYLFRTYVLDGTVEGHHVNVRMQPDVEAPVLAQFNEGDKVDGQICLANQKWLEIAVPSSVRFYVYKDYVENIGDEHLYSIIEARREEVNRLLETAYEKVEDTFKRDFDEIDIDPIIAQLQHIIHHYKDFTEQVEAAKNELFRVEELFMQRKIAYLEGEHETSQTLVHRNKQLSHEIQAKQERIHQLENQIYRNQHHSGELRTTESVSEENMATHTDHHDEGLFAFTHRMKIWLPQEEALFAEWQKEHGKASIGEFYARQSNESSTLRGVLETYDRPLMKKPGDFVLLDKETRLPLAYLYSTRINLDPLVGQEVTLEVAERPNHHFAYKAFYVLDIDHIA